MKLPTEILDEIFKFTEKPSYALYFKNFLSKRTTNYLSNIDPHCYHYNRIYCSVCKYWIHYRDNTGCILHDYPKAIKLLTTPYIIHESQWCPQDKYCKYVCYECADKYKII